MPFTVEGLDDTVSMIEGVASRYRQIQRGTAPVLRVVAQDIKTAIDDSFRKSRSPMGDEWQTLAPATFAARRPGRVRSLSGRIASGPVQIKPLIDTGDLLNSINSKPRPKGVRFGSNKVYAATHQFGRGAIPARPFLPIEGGAFGNRGPAAQLSRDIRDDVAKWLADG